jgi:hypothetical protein
VHAAATEKGIAALRALGYPAEWADLDWARAREPALRIPDDALAAAFFAGESYVLIASEVFDSATTTATPSSCARKRRSRRMRTAQEVDSALTKTQRTRPMLRHTGCTRPSEESAICVSRR